MRCELIKERMVDRLDGRLDDERTREMDEHLANCEDCRRELEELRQTIALIRELPAVMPPADLVPAVRRRLARRRESPLTVFWNILSLPQVRVAAAAALVVMVGAYGWRALTASPGGIASDGAAPVTRDDRIAETKAVAVAQPMICAAPAAAPAVRTLHATEPAVPVEGGAPSPPKTDQPMERPRLTRPDKTGLSIGKAGTTERAPPSHREQPDAPRASLPMPAAEIGWRETRVTPGAAPGSPGLADKLAVASAARAPEGETKGQIWNGPGAAGGPRNPEELVGGLSVGKESARPPAPAVAPVRPSRSADRDIMLATSDASAVRKIVSEFVVRKEERADEAAVVGGMKDAEVRRGWATEGRAPIEGWVPAARYAQLVASLRSVGTIQPALSAAGFRATTADDVAASPAKQARTKEGGAALIFVRITLIPPGQ